MPLIYYVASEGSSSNINVIAAREAGFRSMISPYHSNFDIDKYAIDNGAWICYGKGLPFNDDMFLKLLRAKADDADFIVIPDIVGGGKDSLALSIRWQPRLPQNKLLLYAVQDGMEPQDIEPLLSPVRGIFLGGTTEWKLATGVAWGSLAAKHGCYFHVGRVNTRKRMLWASAINANSCDGSSVARYKDTIPLLKYALEQPSLLRSRK